MPNEIGAMPVIGVEEAAVCTKTGKVVVKVDPNYFRPTEVELPDLQSDFTHYKLNNKFLSMQFNISSCTFVRATVFSNLNPFSKSLIYTL